MEEFYLKKFKHKTDAELEKIARSVDVFQPEAVAAASQLLEERNRTGMNVIAAPPNAKISSQSEVASDSFNITPFIRTFSYRDVFTSFTLVIFYLAFIGVLEFYADEWFDDNVPIEFYWGILIGMFIANHIMYRIEHKRSNNFIGRSVHTFIVLVVLFITHKVYLFLSGYDLQINTDGVIIMLFGVVILIFFFEFLLGLLKALFHSIGWRAL